MNYLTNYYKNLCEQLQQKIKLREVQLKKYLMEMNTSFASTQQNVQQTDAPKTKDPPTKIEEPLFDNPNFHPRPVHPPAEEPYPEEFSTFEEWYIAWIYWWMNYGGGVVGPHHYDMEKFNENDLEQIRQYLKQKWRVLFHDKQRKKNPNKWKVNPGEFDPLNPGPRYA